MLSMLSGRSAPWMHAFVVVAVVFAVYGVDAGRGFVKDDFRWTRESRVRTLQDARQLFIQTSGFYRPVVSWSFAANEWLGGTNPRGYGLANLALAIGSALALGWLVHAHGLPPGASVFAGSVWILNFHGINMAVLWISGRTALLLTLFAVLAAVAAVKQKPLLTAVLTVCAMLSKEEGVLLPLLLLFIAAQRHRGHVRPLVLWTACLCCAEIAYFGLRLHSNAMTPANAPSFYQFTFAPSDLLRNILEYADRSASLTLALLLLLASFVRRRVQLAAQERTLMTLGALWIVVGFAITVFLPVRSSLYACFPSVGVALAGAAVASALWRLGDARRLTAAAICALILPVLLIPIYRQRNLRWVELAALTRNLTPTLREAANAATDGNILLVDDRTTRVSLLNAYGALLADAVELASGTRRTIWLVPAPADADPRTVTPVVTPTESSWELYNRQLRRVDGAVAVGASANILR